MFYDTSSVTRQGSCHLPPLGKACRKSSLFLLKCYFFKSLWQSNKKSVICFYIPLNPSVRRVRRVYTLILNFTLNYAMHFSKKTINPTCQCFLLVTFLSRKKSDKTHPNASPRVLRVPFASPRVLKLSNKNIIKFQKGIYFSFEICYNILYSNFWRKYDLQRGMYGACERGN